MTTAWAPPSPRPVKSAAAREAAEALAISALGWLAQDGETLERFLSLSGLTPETLRQAAAALQFRDLLHQHVRRFRVVSDDGARLRHGLADPQPGLAGKVEGRLHMLRPHRRIAPQTHLIQEPVE